MKSFWRSTFYIWCGISISGSLEAFHDANAGEGYAWGFAALLCVVIGKLLEDRP